MATTQELGKEAGKIAMCETKRQMEKAGFTLPRLLLKLDDLMNAQKPISCIKGKEADGGTVDFIDVPDNQVQIKALDMAFTLRDDYPMKKIKADVNHSGSIMAAVASHLSQVPEKAEKETRGYKGKIKKVKRRAM